MKRGNGQEMEGSICENRNEKPQRARFSLGGVKKFSPEFERQGKKKS